MLLIYVLVEVFSDDKLLLRLNIDVDVESVRVDKLLDTKLCALFNCATLTASVSKVPAARPVICLVTVEPLPTATEPALLFQADEVTSFACVPVTGSYPVTPFLVEATESLPKATPSSILALAL